MVEDPLGIMVAPTAGSAVGPGGAVGFGAYPPDEAAHVRAMDEAKSFLDDLVAQLKHRKINAVADIDTGEPAARIVDYAADHDVDLIVMSTHGRTGVKRWTYGSVAAKVLQAAPCPVVVVRPAGHG
ncbi:MAG: universal stress protein [Caldilineaceae bacterium]